MIFYYKLILFFNRRHNRVQLSIFKIKIYIYIYIYINDIFITGYDYSGACAHDGCVECNIL